MTRYVFNSRGKLVQAKASKPQPQQHVMSDIQPYKSMITGEQITSRSFHRDHLKAHGCIEIGNEKMESKPVQTDQRAERRKILSQQLGDMSDRQANKILKELRREHGR